MIVVRGLGRDSVDTENGNISIFGMGLWHLVIVIPVTPDCRILLIASEGRTLIIAIESRNYQIDPESRTVQVSCTSGGV